MLKGDVRLFMTSEDSLDFDWMKSKVWNLMTSWRVKWCISKTHKKSTCSPTFKRDLRTRSWPTNLNFLPDHYQTTLLPPSTPLRPSPHSQPSFPLHPSSPKNTTYIDNECSLILNEKNLKSQKLIIISVTFELAPVAPTIDCNPSNMKFPRKPPQVKTLNLSNHNKKFKDKAREFSIQFSPNKDKPNSFRSIFVENREQLPRGTFASPKSRKGAKLLIFPKIKFFFKLKTFFSLSESQSFSFDINWTWQMLSSCLSVASPSPPIPLPCLPPSNLTAKFNYSFQ